MCSLKTVGLRSHVQLHWNVYDVKTLLLGVSGLTKQVSLKTGFTASHLVNPINPTKLTTNRSLEGPPIYCKFIMFINNSLICFFIMSLSVYAGLFLHFALKLSRLLVWSPWDVQRAISMTSGRNRNLGLTGSWNGIKHVKHVKQLVVVMILLASRSISCVVSRN